MKTGSVKNVANTLFVSMEIAHLLQDVKQEDIMYGRVFLINKEQYLATDNVLTVGTTLLVG